MLRFPVLAIVLGAIVAAGCGVDGAGESTASFAEPASSPTPRASTIDRVPLPSGFPVFPGAVPLPLPDDDRGLIAVWRSEQLGAAAYDFYAAALEPAGYPIVGLYPGGDAALIRFRTPGGAIWQIVAQSGANGTTTIEIRLDRP
ncbi:MAG: hypothetical protein ABI978_00575 [Chloroflexota bacterium]